MVLGSDSWAVFTLMSSPAKAHTKVWLMKTADGVRTRWQFNLHFGGHRQFTYLRRILMLDFIILSDTEKSHLYNNP